MVLLGTWNDLCSVKCVKRNALNQAQEISLSENSNSTFMRNCKHYDIVSDITHEMKRQLLIPTNLSLSVFWCGQNRNFAIWPLLKTFKWDYP